MSIRKKILLYVSTTIILLMGATFVFVYTLFAEYREEEFQQRQKEKILTTLKFLTDVEEMNESIAQAMDNITIHDFYDEKMLIYNEEKKLIYSSIDDLPISISNSILEQLSLKNNWIETKEEAYDVIGIYIKSKGKEYYGISKAYDEFGFTKLNYLGTVLLLVFIGIAIVVLIISFYLSRRIANPILEITHKIKEYDFEKDNTPIVINEHEENEIFILAKRFNELMKRTNDAFAFQKHAVHHISHELKTPISVLVLNFEKIEKENDLEQVKKYIAIQKRETKSLGNIINTLLEIAKIEAGYLSEKSNIRIDELIFDIAEELQNLHPEFVFQVEYQLNENTEENLTIEGNTRLLKSVLLNLMENSIHYNSKQHTNIVIKNDDKNLILIFKNLGKNIREEELPYIFQHFFRGENSSGKSGFGLGLVLVHKIINLHQGEISYETDDDNWNIFKVKLPK